MKHLNLKSLVVILAMGLVWMTLCGFEGLEEETSAGIGVVMSQLTHEDVNELTIMDEWENKVIANVKDYVSIRETADSNGKVLGRLFKGDGGEIVERADGWTLIRSGKVEGYVSNDYLLFGMDAYDKAQEELQLVATSTTDGLRIRNVAGTDSKVLKNVEKGAKLVVVEEKKEETEEAEAAENEAEDAETEASEGEWICVEYAEGKTGYVAADYVTVEYKLGEAMTMKEIQEKEAAAKKEKLKQQLASVKASASDVQMLAAIIQSEAGGQPYEGKVAVGAVVMNRVKSPRYPNTIADVIYAPGQFGVVNNGTFAAALSRLSPACVQAAQDAINGYTTVGSFTHFRRAGAAVVGDCIVIGAHVFY